MSKLSATPTALRNVPILLSMVMSNPTSTTIQPFHDFNAPAEHHAPVRLGRYTWWHAPLCQTADQFWWWSLRPRIFFQLACARYYERTPHWRRMRVSVVQSKQNSVSSSTYIRQIHANVCLCKLHIHVEDQSSTSTLLNSQSETTHSDMHIIQPRFGFKHTWLPCTTQNPEVRTTVGDNLGSV